MQLSKFNKSQTKLLKAFQPIATTCERSVRSQGDENPVKKRGRPRKEVPKEPNTPKAAPKKAVRMKPPSVNESSREEETPLTRDDMGTLLLDDLVKRKQSQQQARRTMWSQLSGLSLKHSDYTEVNCCTWLFINDTLYANRKS